MRSRAILALALAALTATPAFGQSSPGFVTGQVPSAAQWNAAFAAHADYPLVPFTTTTAGGVPAPGTATGKVLQDDGAWHTPAPGGVTSFNSRTGAITPTTGDYTFAQIGSTPTTLSGYGITDGVSLTGTQTLTNKTLTSPTINGGALSGTFTGTPVLNLTSATSLPISTGVSGLATGIATALGTPSSANWRAAVTDESGTGAMLFANGALGTPVSGDASNLTNLNPANLSAAVAINKGGTGLTSAGVATLTALGGLTGTPSGTTFLAGDGTWKAPTGSGTVNSGTTGQLAYYAAGGAAVSGVGPGTTSTLLHGNAAGAPSFGAVNLASEVTGQLSTSLLSNSQNPQTATTYTIVAGDGGKSVIRSNASAMTDTLPQAGTTGFAAGFAYREMNKGTAALTLNTTTSVFPNGASSLTLGRGQAADIGSDGTDYPEVMMGMPVLAANQVLGNISGTNYPSALSQTQLTALINLPTSTLSGAVPATGTPSGKFLKDDLTWATPGGGGSPGGSTTQIQVNNAGSFGGVSTLTVDLTNGYLTESANAAVSAPAVSLKGSVFTGGTGTTTVPYMYFNQGASQPSTWSTSGTIIGINAVSGFAGNLIDARVNGSSTVAFAVSQNGSLNVQSGLTSGGNVTVGASSGLTWNGRSKITSSNSSGNIAIQNSTGNNFQMLGFGGFSSSLPGIKKTGASSLGVRLSDDSADASLSAAGLTASAALINTGITTDATHTDSTVCQDTTTHQFYFGSGTLGICLGTSTARAKENILAVNDNALNQVMALKPVAFNYKDGWGYDSSKRYFGFLAEDVATVIPELVGRNANGQIQNADYVGMIPLLVKTIQEQQRQIESLMAKSAH